MKKFISIVFIISTLFVFSACAKEESSNAASDKSLEKVEQKNELVVATSGTLFPASYYNEENQLVGYDVDVAREVAKRLDVDVTFKEYNVDGQITSVSKGTADFAANDFGITKEREKKFSLSTPIKHSYNSMIVRQKDDSGIASLSDLKGKKAAGEPNTSYMRTAEHYGAELVTYDNATNDQYLVDVANGRTDVVLNDYYLQKMAVAAFPDIPVKILEDVYYDETTSGFLFKKENAALEEAVNQEIKNMKEDGTLATISESYFGTDVSTKPDVEVIKSGTDE
ncbi:MAG: transporter substrate-binding domain-containing protein [Enterococcus sp.]